MFFESLYRHRQILASLTNRQAKASLGMYLPMAPLVRIEYWVKYDFVTATLTKYMSTTIDNNVI